MMQRRLKFSAAMTAVALLAGCASDLKRPDAAQTQRDAQIQAAAAWQSALPATVPHGGSAAQLVNWWAQLGDPVFNELMQAAQRESATLAGALTGIARSRASVVRSEQALLPQAQIGVQGSRGVIAPKAPPATSLSASAQASWEIDLWGANSATLNAAQLTARGAELGWHEARVAVAAEMASNYMAYRFCEQQLTIVQRDAASRAETARLAELTAKAGLSPTATAQLARASSFDAANSVSSTQAQCDALVKSLVALSGMEEPVLREKLKANQVQVGVLSAQNALFSVANAVTQVPAQMLAQRPDIAAAQLAVTRSAFEIQTADAARYPSLSLSGSIGVASNRQLGVSTDGSTWSLGPIALTVPLTQQAAIRSNTQAAIAAYDEAVISLRAKARQAVREVEESLVNLNSTQLRATQAKAPLKAMLRHSPPRKRATARAWPAWSS